MNSIEKKIHKVLTQTVTEDLTEYGKILKEMKKTLGITFFGTRKIAAALLKEYLGDINNFRYDPALFNLNESEKPKEIDREKSKPKEKGSFVFEDVKDGKVRLFINIGKVHRVAPGDLIREIVKHTSIDGKLIGKIDIHQNYSFIEIPIQMAETVLVSFDNVRIRGTNVVIEPAKKKKQQ